MIVHLKRFKRVLVRNSLSPLRLQVVEAALQRLHTGPEASTLPEDVAEAPWSVAEWAVALRFDNPRATVLVLVLG